MCQERGAFQWLSRIVILPVECQLSSTEYRGSLIEMNDSNVLCCGVSDTIVLKRKKKKGKGKVQIGR